MANDELIRQVATVIRRNHHSGTMEEAMDAAKAVLVITEERYQRQRAFYELKGLILSGLTDWPEGDERLTMQAIVSLLAKLHVLHQGVKDGEDYQLLSTEPQIVNEIIEPEAKG